MPPQDDQQNTNVPNDSTQFGDSQMSTPPVEPAAPAPDAQPPLESAAPAPEAWPPQEGDQDVSAPTPPPADAFSDQQNGPVLNDQPVDQSSEAVDPTVDAPQPVVGPDENNDQPVDPVNPQQ